MSDSVNKLNQSVLGPFALSDFTYLVQIYSPYIQVSSSVMDVTFGLISMNKKPQNMDENMFNVISSAKKQANKKIILSFTS